MPCLSCFSVSKLTPSELVLQLSVLNPNHMQVPKSQEPIISTVALPVCVVLTRLLDAS